MSWSDGTGRRGVEGYRAAIALDEAVEIDLDDDWGRLVPAALTAVGERGLAPGEPIEDGVRRLQARLAPLEPGALAPEVVAAVETIAAGWNRRTGPPVQVVDLDLVAETMATDWPVADRASLWVGDITRLGADAIVNAANSSLLGCRLPNHPCIDNAIHSGAGPRLRDDCALLVERQGGPEPVGGAKVTRAYALPARFVIHTVGPQLVPGASPSVEEERLLTDAYRHCLDAAASVAAIRTIAFCAISTGVFAYPKPEAARIALDTVGRWLDANPDRIGRVVFNVFSPDDAAVYHRVLTEPAP